MWLPSSAFKEPVTFHTVSKRGRLRKHRMKEGSSAPETQGNNPRNTPTETNLKRKYVHELKTGNTNNHFIHLYSFIIAIIGSGADKKPTSLCSQYNILSNLFKITQRQQQTWTLMESPVI